MRNSCFHWKHRHFGLVTMQCMWYILFWVILNYFELLWIILIFWVYSALFMWYNYLICSIALHLTILLLVFCVYIPRSGHIRKEQHLHQIIFNLMANPEIYTSFFHFFFYNQSTAFCDTIWKLIRFSFSYKIIVLLHSYFLYCWFTLLLHIRKTFPVR